MSYKITINANIWFDYYPYEKTTSEEMPCIVNHNELATYDDYYDVELEITPKMLLEAIRYVYDRRNKELVSSYQETLLIDTFEKCPYFFEKICAEIFDDDNLDSYSSFYDYLTSTDEFKKKEKEIIENEVRGLGELYE